MGRVCAFLGAVWCVSLQWFLDWLCGVEDRWCLSTRLLMLLNCFFPLWWLFLVVVSGGFGDLSCGFSYGCGLLDLI